MNSSNCRLPITLLLCLLPVRLLAQTDNVDTYVRAQMNNQHIPGLALAILKNGEVIKLEGYGFANVEHQVLVKPETIFQSGKADRVFRMDRPSTGGFLVAPRSSALTIDERAPMAADRVQSCIRQGL